MTLAERLSAQGADTASGLERFLNDERFYETYLLRFPANSDMAELEKAVAVKDPVKGQFHVHTLKGAAGNLGLTGVFEAAAHMNALFRAGKNEEAFAAYKGVKAAFDAAVRIIEGGE